MAGVDGGEEDPPVERGGILEERGDLPEQSLKYVGDYSQVLEPLTFRPLFEDFGIQGFFFGAEGLHKQHRLAYHVVSLSAVRFLIVVKEGAHLPRGKGRLGEVLRKNLAVLGYCARNGNDHPHRGPRGDRPLSDQLREIFGEGAIQRQPAGYPPLGASHQRGDPALGQVMVVMEFPHEGGLLDNIPLSAMGPGEDRHEGLFLRAVPDLRHHHVPPAVPHSLHPEVAVEEHVSLCDDHGHELACMFDGGGEGQTLFGPLYSCMGIAEVELPYLDLPDFSMSFHDEELTGEDRYGPSRLVSCLIHIHARQMSVCQPSEERSRLVSCLSFLPGYG